MRYAALVDVEACGGAVLHAEAKAGTGRASRRGERLPGGPKEEEEEEEEEGSGGREESLSAVECRRLLAFSQQWSLLKDSVWSAAHSVPSGALLLTDRRFLSLTPGTGWFYRAAGVGSITSLTELYAQLLQPSNGSFSSLNALEQQVVCVCVCVCVVRPSLVCVCACVSC